MIRWCFAICASSLKVFRNLTENASAEEQQLSADMAMTLGMKGVDDCCGVVPDI